MSSIRPRRRAKQALRPPKRNYIGLACSNHDAAIAIVDSEGEVLFAEGAERYLQHKRAFGAPPDDLQRSAELIRRYCDADAELVVAKSWSRGWYLQERLMVRGVGLWKAFRRATRRWRRRQASGDPWSRPSADLESTLLAMPAFLWRSQMRASAQAAQNLRIQPFLINRGIDNRVIERRLDHHRAHATAACWSSPFEEAVVAIIDGFGEGTSTAYYRYQEGKIERLRVPQRSFGSLGAFYMMLCELCGFEMFKGEEWKVMGLAPYGHFDPRIYAILRPLVRVDGLRIHSRYKTTGFDALRRRSDAPAIQAADLAHTGQQIFEEVMQELLSNLHALGVSDHLVLGGGCALNSSWNGQILDRTPFEALHVPSAPADDGNALGAALLAFQQDHRPQHRPAQPRSAVLMRPTVVRSPYLGSAMSARTIERMIDLGRVSGAPLGPGAAPERAAQLLAQGKIIGWVQGGAEYGPRALGNRSILADPRPSGIKDRLNAEVKFREEFRPFAPSILHEHGPRYFERYQMSPYMERTLRFRKEMQDRVPGVVHVNGTGRVQSVTAELNPRFYALISAFNLLTGVPLVLNTSFNVMGKPIIHSVEDALAVFFTSGLDALIIDDYVVEKSHATLQPQLAPRTRPRTFAA